MHPKLQIQEPNKLSNPKIQNQQNPPHSNSKNHIHISKHQIEKKKTITQIKNWKIKENPLQKTYPWVRKRRLCCTVAHMDNKDNKLALLIRTG